MYKEIPEDSSLLDSFHEFLIHKDITIKKFNKKFRSFPQRLIKFRLFNKITNKEYFVKSPTQDNHFCGIVTNEYYMFGYFFMKRGLHNKFRWKQLRLLMQKENLEEIKLRIYPMYNF